MKKVGHKNAFTLAEVLVTLGIIGIVAALTLPTLIANYKKQVYVNQLKKTYSMLEQGFQKMLADEGVDSLANTEVFGSIKTQCIASTTNDQRCDAFFEKLKQYFVITDIGKTGNYKYAYIKKGSTPAYPDNNPNSSRIILEDGTMLFKYNITQKEQPSSYSCDAIKALGGKMCSKMGNITIDVNGYKGPNIEGRDIFSFNISSTGELAPYWSTDSVIYAYRSTSKVWYNNPSTCGTSGQADAHLLAQYGAGCAARIIDSGWKMDY